MVAPRSCHSGLTAAHTRHGVTGGRQGADGVATAAFAAEGVVSAEGGGTCSTAVTLQAFDIVLAQALGGVRVAGVHGVEGSRGVTVAGGTPVRIGGVEGGKTRSANLALEPYHVGLAEALSDDLSSGTLVLDAVPLVSDPAGVALAGVTGGGVRGEAIARSEEPKLASVAIDTSYSWGGGGGGGGEKEGEGKGNGFMS